MNVKTQIILTIIRLLFNITDNIVPFVKIVFYHHQNLYNQLY